VHQPAGVPPVTLRVARAPRCIGMPVTQAQCAEVFQRLGLAFTEAEGTITVTPPSWRFDLQIEEDLIEEVAASSATTAARTTPPLAPVTPRLRTESRRSRMRLRRRWPRWTTRRPSTSASSRQRWEQELAGNADPIRVLNPIAAPLAVMRSSLMGSLVGGAAPQPGAPAAGCGCSRLGRVFRATPAVADGELTTWPASTSRCAWPAWPTGRPTPCSGAAERAVDFFDVKGDVEALLAPRRPRFVPTPPGAAPGPLRAHRARRRGHRPCGRTASALAPGLRAAAGAAAVRAGPRRGAGAAPVPVRSRAAQQAVVRDMALVVATSVTHDALMAAMRCRPDPAWCVRATLFDVYRPKPGAGIARRRAQPGVRLELLDDEAPLTDERIDATVAAAVDARKPGFGARLRG
jgi:phenylalanyl-tRNA synthetase beta chain